jgi:amidase
VVWLRLTLSTGGFFAKDASLLRKVGDVLLDPSTKKESTLRRWLVAKDAFGLAEPAVSSAIHQVLLPRQAAH